MQVSGCTLSLIQGDISDQSRHRPTDLHRRSLLTCHATSHPRGNRRRHPQCSRRYLLHRRQWRLASGDKADRSGICAASAMFTPVIAWHLQSCPWRTRRSAPCNVASIGNGAAFALGNNEVERSGGRRQDNWLIAQLAQRHPPCRLVNAAAAATSSLSQRQPGHLGAKVGRPDLQRQRGDCRQCPAFSSIGEPLLDPAAKLTSCSGGGSSPQQRRQRGRRARCRSPPARSPWPAAAG